jgi:hypothetical protein
MSILGQQDLSVAHLNSRTSIMKTSASRRCMDSPVVRADGPSAASAEKNASSSTKPSARRSSRCPSASGWSSSTSLSV